MLTRPIMVRRLVPGDQPAYDKDPAAYAGEWVSDPKDVHGEVVSEHFFTSPGPNGEPVQVPYLGVCWQNVRRPAIEYVPVALLENVDNLYEEGDDEEELSEPEQG